KKQKNHEYLIDIFLKVHEERKNAILLLIGDGEERKKIHQKVVDNGLENNVIFTGLRADIHDLLQALDVLVFPSLFEGFGIVAIESQAAGLPTILSNTIPKETHLTSLVESLDLSEIPDNWSESILNADKKHKRMDTSQEIIENGY